MQFGNIIIRAIEEKDNAALAKVIRQTLEEFGANHPGTVYFDSETDQLSKVFETPGSGYFVAEKDGAIVGGAGIYPTQGLPVNTCELVKMYLRPEVRGIGFGKFLLHQCFEKAKQLGYDHIYLETMPELTIAVPMYEKNGFRYLDGPLGQTGHFGCAIQMIKDL